MKWSVEREWVSMVFGNLRDEWVIPYSRTKWAPEEALRQWGEQECTMLLMLAEDAARQRGDEGAAAGLAALTAGATPIKDWLAARRVSEGVRYCEEAAASVKADHGERGRRGLVEFRRFE